MDSSVSLPGFRPSGEPSKINTVRSPRQERYGCTAGKVAALGVIFLVLSGAGVGVLFYLKLQQYAVIAYGTGGVSAAVLIGVAIRSCCSQEPVQKKAEQKSAETKIDVKKPPTQAEKAEAALNEWLDAEELPTNALKGGFYEKHETQYAAIKFGDVESDTKRIYFATGLFPKHDELLNKLLDRGEDRTIIVNRKNPVKNPDSPDWTKWEVKVVLWAKVVEEDGSLSAVGRALIATGDKPIYVAPGNGNRRALSQDGATCLFENEVIDNLRHLVIYQGWYAKLIEELRDTLKELYGKSSTSSSANA